MAFLLRLLLKEPLFHFIVLALVIFATYGMLNRNVTEAPDRIVVTAPKIEQLVYVFAQTWKRPPTTDELKGLIDDYVAEEIYVREALALDLDKDDTVIRRRLRLKMEFLTDAAVDSMVPTDEDLKSYLTAHSKDFEVEPMLAFQQIFLNPERHGDKIQQDAASLLDVLLTSPAADLNSLGDTSLLPPELPLTAKSSIGQTFGSEFSEALDKADLGQWTGPIASSYGLHFIRVSERRPGRTPTLDQVREAVSREWVNAKRQELERLRFADLLKRYVVTIEASPTSETTP